MEDLKLCRKKMLLHLVAILSAACAVSACSSSGEWYWYQHFVPVCMCAAAAALMTQKKERFVKLWNLTITTHSDDASAVCCIVVVCNRYSSNVICQHLKNYSLIVNVWKKDFCLIELQILCNEVQKANTRNAMKTGNRSLK